MLLDYPDILSVEQVCEILQTSKRTVYNLIHSQKLTAKKIACHYRIHKNSLITYLCDTDSKSINIASTHVFYYYNRHRVCYN